MSELREQLARRLAARLMAIACQTETTKLSVKAAFALAEECIRQMGWCAFQAAHSYRSSEGYDDVEDAKNDSRAFVTLAPEEWKP